MARQPRSDGPGRWFHVMNRGANRQTVFRSRDDARVFESLIARTCRTGDLELHAHCLMGNHFHMLVRSPVGRLAAAMHLIEHNYARWFNLTEGRDGPLFRGRYLARAVEDDAYRCTVIRYIDANPVIAGLCDHAGEWEASSAHRIATGRTPPWLCSDYVDSVLEQRRVARNGRWMTYCEAFGIADDDEHDLVERRFARPAYRRDMLGFLSKHPADAIADWLEGVRPDQLAHYAPVALPRSVEAALAAVRALEGPGPRIAGQRKQDPEQIVRVGLLTLLGRLNQREVASETGRSAATVSRAGAVFFAALERDPEFVAHVARVIFEIFQNRASPALPK